MKSMAPCKGCEKREVGCHATCDLYISWKEKYQEGILKKKADNEAYPIETMFKKKCIFLKKKKNDIYKTH